MGFVLLGFSLYLIFIVGIGVYASKFSSKGISEYYLAGRNLNFFVMALSAVASGRSAWLLLGFTGMAYTMGASAIWAAIGYTVVELWLFWFYAPRLRQFSEHHGCITVPDFFAARFPDKADSLRILLTVLILVFMVAYIAAQLVAGGKAFESTFGIDQTTGIVFTSLIILFYTVLGGFLAVSITDMVQGIFMVVALVLVPMLGIHQFGGWEKMLLALPREEFGILDPMAISAGALWGFLGIGLGSPGSPHILVRYMAIRHRQQLLWSGIIGTGWNVVMAVGALFIGLVGRAYFPDLQALPQEDPEQLFPQLAGQVLPPAIFGLVIASVFAAIMSTADSQLLVAASSIVRDFYQKVLKKEDALEEKHLVRRSRLVVILLVLFALGFGFLAQDLVFWLVLFAWAGLGAAIGPTSILALFWRQTSGTSVIAGMVTGATLVVLWRQVPFFKEQIWDIYEMIPAFFVASLVTIIVSLRDLKD